ncbi:MAG TPA: nucleotidyltransferase family protein, partial [Stellaceae bacterium]|nr:nucleotidyltransferase family protein [Stellaceae bacterium]
MRATPEPELAQRLTEIVRAVPSLMRVLTVVRALDLPDWLVMSGAVYQRVLNRLTGRDPDYGV